MGNESKQTAIGIMIWGLQDLERNPYLRNFSEQGASLGVDVFFFSPLGLAAESCTLWGYVAAPGGGWESRAVSWPAIVIDQCYRYGKSQASLDQYHAVRRQGLFPFANRKTGHKLHIHELLAREGSAAGWLPDTEQYSHAALQAMLARCPVVYVKPVRGTGGRGVLRITCEGQQYWLLGRNAKRIRTHGQASSMEELLELLTAWVGRRTFILQKGIPLELLPRRTVDLRLLIQKDGQGRWTVTGAGLRIGREDSPTSNLHGGGQGVAPHDLLDPLFGSDTACAILDECAELALTTASVLECAYGQLMELGLDIGIDPEGRIWLIEVNSMPQREIFRHMNQPELYQLSFRRPLQYALFLLSAETGTVDG